MEYRGNAPELSVTFRYPKGWRLQEEAGTMERYRQVRVLGPRNHDDTYTCYLSVRGAPVKSHGGKYATIHELIGSYRAYAFRDATVEAEAQPTVSGLKAREMTVSYVVPPQHKPRLKPIAIPVKTRILFLEKGPYLYEVSYSADAREYDQRAGAFDRLIKSFRFH